MRWTIRLELEDEDGRKQDVQIFSLERPLQITEAELGLAHAEGKRLLLAVQQQLVRQQLAAYGRANGSVAKRPCSNLTAPPARGER